MKKKQFSGLSFRLLPTEVVVGIVSEMKNLEADARTLLLRVLKDVQSPSQPIFLSGGFISLKKASFFHDDIDSFFAEKNLESGTLYQFLCFQQQYPSLCPDYYIVLAGEVVLLYTSENDSFQIALANIKRPNTCQVFAVER